MMLLSVAAGIGAQNNSLNEANLLSRLGHHEQGLGQSAYHFSLMARSDNWPAIVRSDAVLYYGSMSMNGDSDWFSVSGGGPRLTRIKDLGAKQWTEVEATPFVPVTPHSSDGIRAPRRDQSYEESSEGRVTKIVLGHLYVIHFKNEQEDFYVMLRVDELVPSDRCRISWRVVPPADEMWKIN
jgi:hypothetical protein